ncbi:adenine-specific DNA-methyltransferase [Thioclava sp. ES.031]|uniref:site-specific DNA-methyltransferase n=1 Tax=Thioclava sp. ES.031 TaxID=1798203 RepID=UPI000BF45DE6|nr:site-specific DNA-methyltransferase [Thioclava sp. ES.031]PFG64319.1 adenine-specific DNA-methyltransferase [Thioclava sp. ES.031]
MAPKKNKLELTWIGKDNRPRLEPRILIEELEFSHHASTRREGDIFDNMLIHGDNLLALKALETDPAVRGKVKCVFIDPPYNTGSAFEHYDDGLEHSLWLSMIRDRLELLKNLLSEDGSIWITIDDNEAHYLKVLCDEVFGRKCFVADAIWRTSDNSNNNATKFSQDHNNVLVYGKNAEWRPNFLNDPSKRKHFKNPDNDPRGPWFDGNPVNNPALRPNLQFDITAPNGHVIKHPPNGWRWSLDTIKEKMKTGEIRFSEDGKRLIRRTYLNDMDKGLPPSTLWVNLDETGHNRQAKYELKTLFPDVPVTSLFGTPKPERLIEKVLKLATGPGDLVLDSFAGSGTTGAVAHKMGRRWIMVELGEHAKTHVVPRMKKVIEGTDKGGVSEATNWKGGGGYRFFRLAPSLLQKDVWGNWIISKDYNAEMLAEAMCKHFNYVYAPSDEAYWMHGQASENAFIYVTTASLTFDQLRAISDEVGEGRSLLICCMAYEAQGESLDNLTLKKIPRVVLDRCEWGKDDYSLRIDALPMAEEVEEIMEEDASAPAPAKTKAKTAATPDLFREEE